MDQLIKLTEMPNIGKVVAEKLIQVGITTPEELKAVGSEQAFIRLQTIDETACLSMLQALEGAVQGMRWHNLPRERKEELMEFFRMRRM
ncbi:MAG: TfoX/Sxy family protein [Prolixibacteraceae bacterium]|nr:TfoX/Sxy family protein [Prolixibacteraceae bacterium]